VPSMSSCSRSVLLAVAVLAATTGALPAQRSIGVSVGRAAVREYNQLASPLNYAGGATALSLGYYNDAPGASWGVQLDAQLAGLTPEADAVGGRASVDRVRLHVPVLRQIVGSATGANVRLGAALVADLLYRNHAYGAGTSSEPYLDAFTGLDAVLRAGSQVGATRVSLDVALSAVRVAWRTPYSGLKYVPAAQLALPDRYHGVDSELLLQHPMSARWSWTAALRMSALSDAGEWSLQRGTRELSLGLRRQLGGTVAAQPATVENANAGAR
jgi:hypothetical protein